MATELYFFTFLTFLGGLLMLLPFQVFTFNRLVEELSRLIPFQAHAKVIQLLVDAESWKTASRSVFLWMGRRKGTHLTVREERPADHVIVTSPLATGPRSPLICGSNLLKETEASRLVTLELEA